MSTASINKTVYSITTGGRGPAGTGSEETTASIITKLGGSDGRIGAEVLPDALSGAGNPNTSGGVGVPDELTITGITTPTGSNPLLVTRVTDLNGFPSWTVSGGWQVAYFPVDGVWAVSNITGGPSLNYSSSVTSVAETPVGLTFGAPTQGAGIPVVSGGIPLTASYIGQLYHDTFADVWYRATAIGVGTSAWQEDAGGASTWDDITGKPATFDPTIGSAADEAVAGNDARLTDARTPTAHDHELDELDATGITAGKVLTASGTDTATWEDPSGTVDNAAVNAAIATNPAATNVTLARNVVEVASSTARKTLTTYTQADPVIGIYAGFTVREMDTGDLYQITDTNDVTIDDSWELIASTRARVPQSAGRGKLMAKMLSASPRPRIVMLGDSIATGLNLRLPELLPWKFGSIVGQGPGNPIHNTLAGGAAAVTNDFSYWTNGRFLTLPAAGTITFRNNPVSAQSEASLAKIYYVTEPGAGEYKIQVSYNGAAFVDTGSTINTDGVLGSLIASVSLARGLNTVQVVGVSGTTKFIGLRYETEGENGALMAAVAEGGFSVAQMASAPAATIAAVWADMAPDVIVYAMHENPATITDDLPGWYDAVNTAIGYVPDWIFCGPCPATGTKARERQYLAMFAAAKNQTFVDSNAVVGGMIDTDGTHPTVDGYRALLSHILSTGPFAQAPQTIRRMENDSSYMSRANSPLAALQNVNRLWKLTPHNLATSGAGAVADFYMGGASPRMESGTAINGYGKATLQRGITAPVTSGFGINFSFPIRLAISASAELRATGCARIIIGSSGNTQAAADADAVGVKGFGMEFRLVDGDSKVRAFAHDGTTYRVSDWVFVGSTNSFRSRIQPFMIESDGTGNVYLYAPDAPLNYTTPPPSYPRAAIIGGGPVGAGTNTQHFIDANACNDSTGTPTTTRLYIYNSLLEVGR